MRRDIIPSTSLLRYNADQIFTCYVGSWLIFICEKYESAKNELTYTVKFDMSIGVTRYIT